MSDETTTPEPAGPAESGSGLARLRAMTRGTEPAPTTVPAADDLVPSPVGEPRDAPAAAVGPQEHPDQVGGSEPGGGQAGADQHGAGQHGADPHGADQHGADQHAADQHGRGEAAADVTGDLLTADQRPAHPGTDLSGTGSPAPTGSPATHAGSDLFGTNPAGTDRPPVATGTEQTTSVHAPLPDAVVVAPSGEQVPAQVDDDGHVQAPEPSSSAAPGGWATTPAVTGPLSLEKPGPDGSGDRATTAWQPETSGALDDRGVEPSGAAARTRSRNRGFGLAGILTSALLTVLLILAVAFGINQTRRHDVLADDNKLRASATASARSYAISFTQFDYTMFDQQIIDLKAISTPTFQKKLDDLQTALAATLTSTQGRSTSSVDNVAVDSFNKDDASVLVFVDQSNTNSAVTTPRVDQYRLIIKLKAVKGAKTPWLVDDIQVV